MVTVVERTCGADAILAEVCKIVLFRYRVPELETVEFRYAVLLPSIVTVVPLTETVAVDVAGS